MAKFPVTVEGYSKLQLELNSLLMMTDLVLLKLLLKQELMANLSENAEYHSAKEKQSFIEGKIAEFGINNCPSGYHRCFKIIWEGN